MQKPTDYPVETEQSDELVESPSGEITYGVLRDRVNAKQPVTEEMIRIARTKLETAHTENAPAKPTSGKFKLPSLRGRFR